MAKDLIQGSIEEGAPWLRGISKLSESDMESIHLFMNSGVFTQNEMREIIRGFSERKNDDYVMSKSMEAAYADVLQTIKEEQNEPSILALRGVRRKLRRQREV